MKPVPGHHLRGRGFRTRVEGCKQCTPLVGWLGASDGHGACECGATSPHLPSERQRQAWHREHKLAQVSA